MITRSERTVAAWENVGRRCHWATAPEVLGTIRAVQPGPGGWPRYVITWDAGAPDWWGRRIACSTRELVVLTPEAKP